MYDDGVEAAVTTMTHVDLSADELINLAIARKEGVLAANQALRVTTGKRTGRSPKDRFIVREASTAQAIDWGEINRPIEQEVFAALWRKASDFLEHCEHFISHLRVGADAKHYLPVKVVTEKAWQNLFASRLFIREAAEVDAAHLEWTVMSVPSLQATPAVDGTHSEAAIILNFAERRVLVIGTHYAGEIKKAMFSVLNFLLPEHGVLPMHCAANVGEAGDVALFFGLSGTGKTTLSADPKRRLIGDDEHGWSDKGVFNFEGGCYAKCIDLSQEREPVIWDAIRRGAIMENVVLDEQGVPDYKDTQFTQNTRAAYPREHIDLRVEANAAGQPKAVLFLTCDLFGVLPPVALLSKEQAAYYFLSGYTALLGSTEVGSSAAIKPTFSSCFGAPFFSRPAKVYADLLIKHVEASGSQVYLVNTGWTGGACGEGGERFSILTTRAVVDAILSGDLLRAQTTVLPHFNLQIPHQVAGVDAQLLDPRVSWASQEQYLARSQHLIDLFKENFKQHSVDHTIIAAGPDY